MTGGRMALAGLTLSAAGLVGIALHEGYRGAVYRDVAGVPTLGFGSTAGVKPGQTTTPERALARALTDIRAFEGALRQCVTVPLAQHEYDAFLSLAYNIGPAAFCGSTLVKKLNAGDYAGACAEIKRWTRAGGAVRGGLVKRRATEYDQCMGAAHASV